VSYIKRLMKILVINGPNLDLLGIRKPGIYGKMSLEDICLRLRTVASESDIEIDFFQSNSEGEIVDKIGSSLTEGVDGIVINPAAYTHTSIAIRDALEAVSLPAVEIHISNIHSREEFRHKSLIAPVCVGQISGFGPDGYELALKGLVTYIANKQN